MEGELKAGGKEADVACLSRPILSPPPSHVSLGAILARPILLPPPSHSSAWPVTKMNNFLLHSSLIRVLGAEQLAPKDRQKFPEPRRAENLTSAKVLTSRANTTGRCSTGETPPIKAERSEPSDHLRSTWTRGDTTYEDLNESSSARLGGSQQLEILPSPKSKKAQNLSA